VPEPPPPFDAWRAELDRAIAVGSRPTTVAATALTEEGTPDAAAEPDPGLQKRPRDLDLPPWLKGRYGSAVGRAVHGVLQSIDLATGGGVDAAVAAQCEAEAVPDRAADVRALVGRALTAPSVHAASVRPHWREVYACTPVGDDRLLEGYIDLLYRDTDGLVVVDYKTAGTSDAAELARRVEGYRLQGAAYAYTVSAATGEPVTRVTFVFLTPDGVVELDLPDLTAAVADAASLVAAGAEIVTD
jgi:ATP-dependent exoDNAse (exonuclease V) beta subunit